MKKLVLLFAAAVFAVSFSACGGGTKQQEAEAEVQPEQVEQVVIEEEVVAEEAPAQTAKQGQKTPAKTATVPAPEQKQEEVKVVEPVKEAPKTIEQKAQEAAQKTADNAKSTFGKKAN